ncbi:MAG: DNA repair and recombination protein RadB [Candidatus Aenigmarchaeota archaeon]|nr:DNA repair and recombination protein RadB [Candidatus Aenigmarchaeota archaeon]
MEDISLPEPVGSILGGKLEKSAITNFFGGPGSGKTNFCLLATMACLKNGGRVVYIDTEGGFSVERFGQLCAAAKLDQDQALENIELLEPKTFEEQRAAIKSLDGKKANLVIVDSIVALYRLEHDSSKGRHKEEIMESSKELSKQLSILSNTARSLGIPVLITAHTFKSWDTGQDEMIGGDVLKYWSKAIVFLERTGRMSERKAVVTKHRSLPEGREAKFLLVEEGIAPVKFKIF